MATEHCTDKAINFMKWEILEKGNEENQPY